MLDPEQGYNHAQFERPPLYSVRQKSNVKVSVISENTSIISLEYVQQYKIMVYSFAYLTYWTIQTKFPLNWIRTQNVQLKLFDTAVTLKYGQGHWKCNEQVKLNEYYDHTKFDSYHNFDVKVFDEPRHVPHQKHANDLP